MVVKREWPAVRKGLPFDNGCTERDETNGIPRVAVMFVFVVAFPIPAVFGQSRRPDAPSR